MYFFHRILYVTSSRTDSQRITQSYSVIKKILPAKEEFGKTKEKHLFPKFLRGILHYLKTGLVHILYVVCSTWRYRCGTVRE